MRAQRTDTHLIERTRAVPGLLFGLSTATRRMGFVLSRDAVGAEHPRSFSHQVCEQYASARYMHQRRRRESAPS